MPPKAKVHTSDIVRAALDVVRENGAAALNARTVAARLGTSTQPIFSHYSTMDALKQDVLSSAHEIYQDYLTQGMSGSDYPPYKASGMAYIRFAKEERELFKLLFMRDRSQERITEDTQEIHPLLQLIQKQTGMSTQDAYLFHLEMWLYVHGIAAMIATSYLEWDEKFIDKALTDAFLGLKYRYCGEGNQNGSAEDRCTDEKV